MILNIIKSQRKSLGRVGKKILALAAGINQAIPGLAQDLTVAALYVDRAEERLIVAETKIEDAERRFADPPGRPAA